jgi:hypothetical protein
MFVLWQGRHLRAPYGWRTGNNWETVGPAKLHEEGKKVEEELTQKFLCTDADCARPISEDDDSLFGQWAFLNCAFPFFKISDFLKQKLPLHGRFVGCFIAE